MTEYQEPTPARFNLQLFARRSAQDYRCSGCGRLLARLIMVPGMALEIKCGRCGRMNGVDVSLNSTSAPVLVALLQRMNGHTPPEVVEAVEKSAPKHLTPE